MSARYETKANEEFELGLKELNKSGFSSFFSSGNKYENAAEHFTKAANSYKMGKLYAKAGEAFVKVAELQLQHLNSRYEAATMYVSAFNMFRKVNTKDAVAVLGAGIELYVDEGRFSMAAKFQKEVAEMLESEGDINGAIEAFQAAADFYEGEGSTSSANQCLLKVANHSALEKDYERAIEIFERVAAASLDSNLLKWSVKDYFFKAVVCYLCNDDQVGGERALERFQDMDMTFASTREARFLQEAISAVEQYDVEAFTNATFEYDKISKLDSWKTSMLLRIKRSLEQKTPDGEDIDDLT